MPTKLLFWFFFLILTTSAFPQGIKRKVLFLGNSYTQYNNLPGLLASAAASVGDTLEFDFNYPGGHTLSQHFSNSQSINKIKAGGWDFVVLQEQSQLPALPQYSFGAAINLSSFIRTHNPCARPLFYMTWGRKNGDSQYCNSWPPVCTYSGMDSLLRMRYLEMAQLSHTEVTPVGVTWKYLRQNHPEIELYQSDESHPSLAGSYAAACSFFASVYKKNPELITHNGGLSEATASVIRLAAKTVVFDSLANWFFPDEPPKAQFSYLPAAEENTIRFINQSLGADSRLWHFGDGDTSTTASPTHTFSANGSFTVSLTVSRCDLGTVFMDSIRKVVQFCAFSPTIFPDTIRLCTQNPDTLWTQEFDGYQWISELGDSIPNATNRYYIPSNAGLYSVKVSQNGCSELAAPAFVDALASFNFYYILPVTPDSICVGDTVLLLLTPVTSPMPPDRDIQWFRNGEPIPFSGNDTLVVTGSGDFQAVVLDTLFCPGSPVFTTESLSVLFQDCQVPVSKKRMGAAVSIFPNPGNEFSLRIPKSLFGSSFCVVDVHGKEIQTGTFNQEMNRLDLSKVKTGIYILKMREGLNFRLVKP